MSELRTVLLVDDDPMCRLLNADALRDQYAILEADSGAAAIGLIAEKIPALVLMDISMDGMDGFETCRRMKSEPGMQAVPVVFVSANVSLEDRLAAYEAGGEDFISKPVAPDELRAKVLMTLKNVGERLQLESGAQSAMQVAMTAMSSAGELGVVINLLRQSFSTTDEASLAECLLGGCAEFGLEACLRFKTVNGIYGRNQQGSLTTVESGVLDLLSDGNEHIRSLGRQSAFCYGGLTLLVKNMPMDDPDRAGRLRDHLAMIAEGGEARLRILDANYSLKAREQAQARLSEKAVAALKTIFAKHQQNAEKTGQLLESMLAELELTFPTLGLTEYQEVLVLDQVRLATNQISELYVRGLDIEQHMQTVMEA